MIFVNSILHCRNELCIMKIATQPLLNELAELTEAHRQFAKELMNESSASLNKKATAQHWSALECIAHLNCYSNYYLKEISESLKDAPQHPIAYYKAGLLGNYFAKIIHPDTSKKSMKTPAEMNPSNTSLNKNEVEFFIRNSEQLLQLLQKASNVHLGKVKTGISLSKFIKLKLGDTLRFVIYHNERHMRQARTAITS